MRIAGSGRAPASMGRKKLSQWLSRTAPGRSAPMTRGAKRSVVVQPATHMSSRSTSRSG